MPHPRGVHTGDEPTLAARQTWLSRGLSGGGQTYDEAGAAASLDELDRVRSAMERTSARWHDLAEAVLRIR